MKNVIRIFEELQATSGKNDKIRIIKGNSENELFRECLKFLLDGSITTGISDKKWDKIGISSDYRMIEPLNGISTVLSYISMNNTGKDEDIRYCKQWAASKSEEEQKFIRGMITKTIKLGADAKLVNTAIPGLIQTFDVMLGTPLEKVKLKPKTWISLSRKLNGCRCAFVGDRLMTRQGKQYTGVQHIIDDLLALGCSDTFVDGELLYKNEEGLSDSEAFQKGTGIAMSKDIDKSCLKLVVFDMFPLSEFWQGKSSKSYKERKSDLLSFKEKIIAADIANIEVVEMFYEGTDHSQINYWLNYTEEHDYEGCMINLDTVYECKRTKNLIKVKRFFTADLRCTGMEAGTGRNENTLGAIICDYKGYPLGVGSGFTDAQRDYYWNHPEEIVGRIVEVRYKEETKSKEGGLSLQFPTIVCVRSDKTEVSYN